MGILDAFYSQKPLKIVIKWLQKRFLTPKKFFRWSLGKLYMFPGTSNHYKFEKHKKQLQNVKIPYTDRSSKREIRSHVIIFCATKCELNPHCICYQPLRSRGILILGSLSLFWVEKASIVDIVRCSTLWWFPSKEFRWLQKSLNTSPQTISFLTSKYTIQLIHSVLVGKLILGWKWEAGFSRKERLALCRIGDIFSLHLQ